MGQCWQRLGNFWETGWGAYGFFSECVEIPSWTWTELNWTFSANGCGDGTDDSQSWFRLSRWPAESLSHCCWLHRELCWSSDPVRENHCGHYWPPPGRISLCGGTCQYRPATETRITESLLLTAWELYPSSDPVGENHCGHYWPAPGRVCGGTCQYRPATETRITESLLLTAWELYPSSDPVRENHRGHLPAPNPVSLCVYVWALAPTTDRDTN